MINSTKLWRTQLYLLPLNLLEIGANNTATIKDVIDIAQKLLAEADEHGENMVHKVLMMLILNRFEDVVNGAANTARERSNFDTADSMDIDARTISQAKDILWKTRMANNDWLADQ